MFSSTPSSSNTSRSVTLGFVPFHASHTAVSWENRHLSPYLHLPLRAKRWQAFAPVSSTERALTPSLPLLWFLIACNFRYNFADAW